MSDERLWRSFFEDPSLWWDNRKNKRSASHPDFKNAATGECLWIHAHRCPPWVRVKLQRLDATSRSIAAAEDLRARARKIQDNEGLRKNYVRISELVAALKACGRSRDLAKGRKIHARAAESGDCSNIFVASTLVDMYAKCGSMEEAHNVFESMEQRNAVAWNCLILGYAENGQGELALGVYSRMLLETKKFSSPSFTTRLNYVTFLAAVKACSSLAARLHDDDHGSKKRSKKERLQRLLEQGRAIHSRALEENDGDELHIFLANALVDMYSKCGSMVEAREIFDGIKHPSVVSWNSIILGYAESGQGTIALELFDRMQRERESSANSVTFLAVFKACVALAAEEDGVFVRGKLVKVDALERTRALHSQAWRGGHLSHDFAAASLVDLYAKCGSMEEARKVFESVPCSVVSWTSMITGYADYGESEQAFNLFQHMQDQGFIPDAVTYVAALKACIKLAENKKTSVKKNECLDKGRELHLQISSRWCQGKLPVFLANALVDMYARGGSLLEARKVFESIEHKSAVSWTSMILGAVEGGEPERALDLFRQMEEEDADEVTIVAALKACASLAVKEEVTMTIKVESLRNGRTLHSRASRHGYDRSCSYIANTLIDMYAECGSMLDARRVFDSMDDASRSVVSWNCLILGYVNNGQPELALQLFSQMEAQSGMKPVAISYVAALKACGSLSALDSGRKLEAEIREKGLLKPGGDPAQALLIVNSLVDFYGKCGSMAEARVVFDNARERDLVTWNTLIEGYSRQGDSESVVALFQRLKSEKLEPDELTFLSLLSVCSHVGLISEGIHFFEAMSSSRFPRVVPGIKHYTCMVGLLSRANRLEEAVELVERMPVEANAVIWMTLLRAACEWNNIQVGRLAFEAVTKLERNGAAYSLMASLYAATGLWQEQLVVRKKMEELGIIIVDPQK